MYVYTPTPPSLPSQEEEESHSATVRLIGSLSGAPPTATPDRPSSEVLLMTRQPTFPQFLRSILPSNSRRFDKFVTIFLQTSLSQALLPRSLSSPPSREHLRYVAVSLPEREIYSRTSGWDGREERKMASVRECLVVDTETGWRNKVCSARPLPSNRMIEAPPTYQPPAVVMATDQQNLPENGSEYQTDTTVPLETTGDQIEPLETTGDQKEPLETTEDQKEPLETTEDQSEPLETTEDQKEPLETTEDQKEPLETRIRPNDTTDNSFQHLPQLDHSGPLETTVVARDATPDQHEPHTNTHHNSIAHAPLAE